MASMAGCEIMSSSEVAGSISTVVSHKKKKKKKKKKGISYVQEPVKTQTIWQQRWEQYDHCKVTPPLQYRKVGGNIINTSYQKLPFGSGDDPGKLLFHQALN